MTVDHFMGLAILIPVEILLLFLTWCIATAACDFLGFNFDDVIYSPGAAFGKVVTFGICFSFHFGLWYGFGVVLQQGAV